jgi:hypothetical protein
MLDETLAARSAAQSLITLATPPQPEKNEDSPIATPSRNPSIHNMEYESPDHTRHVKIKCKGTKRPRENLILVLYDAGDTELAVPFIRGENPQLFFDRRDKITRETLEADIRSDVYCTWRKEMLSILINDKRWKLIRDSSQQKRYVYDAIQLVVTRYTCVQWQSEVPCRNCSNPHWRAACQKIKHIYHVLPTLNTRNFYKICDKSLEQMCPLAEKNKDATHHQTRVPQISNRWT